MLRKNKKNSLLSKKELGKLGEIAAKKYLIDKGFEFIAENYFTKYGEIDLIFKNNELLIFVEVKTRRNKNDLSISINQQKTKRIYLSAQIFIEKESVSFKETQFDVIFITIDKSDQVAEIGHRPNFF